MKTLSRLAGVAHALKNPNYMTNKSVNENIVDDDVYANDVAIEKSVWIADNKNDFISNICIDSVKNIDRQLDRLKNDVQNVSQENVDEIVDMIGNVFDNSVRKCNMKKRCNVRKKFYKRMNGNNPGLLRNVKPKERSVLSLRTTSEMLKLMQLYMI